MIGEETSLDVSEKSVPDHGTNNIDSDGFHNSDNNENDDSNCKLKLYYLKLFKITPF